MKIMATTVVILVRTFAGPAAPKRAWLPAPPMDTPISAPLPVCKSTTSIRKMQTATCIVIKMLVIKKGLKPNNFIKIFRVQARAANQSTINIFKLHQIFDVAGFY